MSDDKSFDYLLTGIRTRETSTLVIATVTSSASLVLLGIGDISLLPPPFLVLAGIVIPILGVLYRELTNLTVDQEDRAKILWLLSKAEREFVSINRSNQRAADMRGFILRTLLLFPSWLWILIIYPSFFFCGH